MDGFYFLNILFSLSNVHHSFSQFEEIIILIIKKEKGVEIGEIYFTTHLNTFGSFIKKIMNFKSASLTLSYSFLCNKGDGYIIYTMYDQGVIKKCLNLEQQL
jgi:hypothetical protein